MVFTTQKNRDALGYINWINQERTRKMIPETLWEKITGWFWTPFLWTQCTKASPFGFYCQKRFWHHGNCRYASYQDEGQ